MDSVNYPKSKKGIQCIGPCYEPGSNITHPDTLYNISYKDKTKPFCPIHQQHVDGKVTFVDECFIATKNIDKNRIITDILVPNMHFDCKKFLAYYYDILSYGDLLKWLLKHKNVPLRNRSRLLNCLWGSYVVTNIDDILVDNYIEIICHEWIDDLYEKVKSFLSVENGQVVIKREDNENNNNNKKGEKIKYIKSKFANRNIVYKFLERYNDKIDKPIKNAYIEYILSKLEVTIK